MDRRKFLEKASLYAGGSILAASIPLEGLSVSLSTGEDLRNKKILFVWGGWEGHEPGKCRDIFVPWMRDSGADVIVSDSLDSYLDDKYKGPDNTGLDHGNNKW